MRPGVKGQEDSKTLNVNLNSSLKILVIERLKLRLPLLIESLLHFFLAVGVDEPVEENSVQIEQDNAK